MMVSEKILDIILNVNLNYLDVKKTVFLNSIAIIIL